MSWRCYGSLLGGGAIPRSPPELGALGEDGARHLSNIFAKLDVGSRTSAAAFAYEHDRA